MNSRLIFNYIYIVIYTSYDVTASAKGVPDDLVNSVLRIIHEHEQYLRHNAKVAVTKSADELLKTNTYNFNEDTKTAYYLYRTSANINNKDLVNSAYKVFRLDANFNEKSPLKTNDEFGSNTNVAKDDDAFKISHDFRSNANIEKQYRENTNIIEPADNFILYNSSIVHQDSIKTFNADKENNNFLMARPKLREVTSNTHDAANQGNQVSKQPKIKVKIKVPTKAKRRKRTTEWPTSKWPARYFIDMAHLFYANGDSHRRQYKPNKDHQCKINELVAYMRDHYISTNYFYKEMERIKKQRVVIDELRNLVNYVEQPGRSHLKEIAMNCIKSELKKKKGLVDFWKNKVPNNLNINVLKDPDNDGMIP